MYISKNKQKTEYLLSPLCRNRTYIHILFPLAWFNSLFASVYFMHHKIWLQACFENYKHVCCLLCQQKTQWLLLLFITCSLPMAHVYPRLECKRKNRTHGSLDTAHRTPDTLGTGCQAQNNKIHYQPSKVIPCKPVSMHKLLISQFKY